MACEHALLSFSSVEQLRGKHSSRVPFLLQLLELLQFPVSTKAQFNRTCARGILELGILRFIWAAHNLKRLVIELVNLAPICGICVPDEIVSVEIKLAVCELLPDCETVLTASTGCREESWPTQRLASLQAETPIGS